MKRKRNITFSNIFCTTDELVLHLILYMEVAFAFFNLSGKIPGDKMNSLSLYRTVICYC